VEKTATIKDDIHNEKDVKSTSIPAAGFVSRSKRGGKDENVEEKTVHDEKVSSVDSDDIAIGDSSSEAATATGFVSRSHKNRLSGTYTQEKVTSGGTILDRLGGSYMDIKARSGLSFSNSVESLYNEDLDSIREVKILLIFFCTYAFLSGLYGNIWYMFFNILVCILLSSSSSGEDG
jgi:hypothetical protein